MSCYLAVELRAMEVNRRAGHRDETLQAAGCGVKARKVPFDRALLGEEQLVRAFVGVGVG
jgi:hypothetical protein